MNETQLRPKILTVDDKPENLYALEKLLLKLDVEVIQATSGLEALSLTLEHDFCMAIVDVQMPEMDGYELVELLRGNPSTASLPVIFVSAIFSDEYHHRKGYDAGAVDFLSKPFVPEILLSKARIFLDLYQQRISLEDLVGELNAKNEALENEINQRQQAEIALRKANSDKDKLFSIISHDLRGPFQPLLGNAQLMLEYPEGFSKSDTHAMIGSIYRSGQAVFNLLDNLLTWSQLQRDRVKYDPGPIDLCRLADNTVGLLREMALNKDIELRHTVEPDLVAYADENMVETIIRNLTTNALKFTPAGGQVTIAADCNGNGVSTFADEVEWIEVRVTDTGIGISEEDIDKLFRIDVHHTTAGTAHEAGTGLGLILCQEMVTKNSGQIWVESVLNEGTKVTFTVPTGTSPKPEALPALASQPGEESLFGSVKDFKNP